jgi:hypothetical protein
VRRRRWRRPGGQGRIPDGAGGERSEDEVLRLPRCEVADLPPRQERQRCARVARDDVDDRPGRVAGQALRHGGARVEVGAHGDSDPTWACST